jgi:hypothetical protein
VVGFISGKDGFRNQRKFFLVFMREVNPHAVSYSIEENDQVKDVFCTCGEERWCRHLSAVLYFMEELRSSEIPPSEHVI